MSRVVPPLIGLTGKKRSGKDTVAGILADERGFYRMAFAERLKDAALDLDPVIGPVPITADLPHYSRLSEVIDLLGWEAAKDTVPGVRETLQRLGEAVRDNVDPSAWVDATMKDVSTVRATIGDPVVVSDVRYPNEADAIRDAGGVVFRVTRPGNADDDTHVSETAMDDEPVDGEIVNDGTISDLRAKTLSAYGLAKFANLL